MAPVVHRRRDEIGLHRLRRIGSQERECVSDVCTRVEPVARGVLIEDSGHAIVRDGHHELVGRCGDDGKCPKDLPSFRMCAASVQPRHEKGFAALHVDVVGDLGRSTFSPLVEAVGWNQAAMAAQERSKSGPLGECFGTSVDRGVSRIGQESPSEQTKRNGALDSGCIEHRRWLGGRKIVTG